MYLFFRLDVGRVKQMVQLSVNDMTFDKVTVGWTSHSPNGLALDLWFSRELRVGSAYMSERAAASQHYKHVYSHTNALLWNYKGSVGKQCGGSLARIQLKRKKNIVSSLLFTFTIAWWK